MELIAIGRIVKPHGIRGAMKIEALTCTPERFQKLRTVWIGVSPERAQERRVRSVEVLTQYIVLSVETIDSIEQVDALRNGYVFVRHDERIQLPRGIYFIDDLIGSAVYDEEDVFIGTVTDVLKLPAHDVWLVQTQTKEIMVPVVDEFIRTVDVERKRIVIHVIEGLLE